MKSLSDRIMLSLWHFYAVSILTVATVLSKVRGSRLRLRTLHRVLRLRSAKYELRFH